MRVSGRFWGWMVSVCRLNAPRMNPYMGFRFGGWGVGVGGHWHYFHRQHRVCRCLPLPSKKATTRRLYGVLSDNRDRLLVLTALKFARMHATPRASPGHRGYSRICNPPKRAGCQGESAIGDCLIWSDRKGWWIQTEPISTRLPDLN